MYNNINHAGENEKNYTTHQHSRNLPMNYSDSPQGSQLAPTNSNELQPSPLFSMMRMEPHVPHVPMPQPRNEEQDQHQYQHHLAGPSRTCNKQRNGRRQAAAPYSKTLLHESLGMIARDHPISTNLGHALMGTNHVPGVGGVRRPLQGSTSRRSNYLRGRRSQSMRSSREVH